jgi:hypothetical protein
VFALVARRALEPGSKLAGTKWVAERVAIEGCVGFTDDAGIPTRRQPTRRSTPMSRSRSGL